MPAVSPVGPERDRLLALGLGWREDRTYVGSAAARLDEAAGIPAARWVSPDGKIHAAPPPFSTDSAACAQLESELAARGFRAIKRSHADRFEAAFVKRNQQPASFAQGPDECAALSAAAFEALLPDAR